MKFRILFISVLLVGIFSCTNNHDCTDTRVETTSLENEYACINTKHQVDIHLSEDYTIIKDQQEFEDLVSGDCQPNIDFSTYDLVIGKKRLTNGNSTIDYQLIEDCETKEQTLTVTFNQNESTEAPELTWHILIPELGNEQELNVNIIVE